MLHRPLLPFYPSHILHNNKPREFSEKKKKVPFGRYMHLGESIREYPVLLIVAAGQVCVHLYRSVITKHVLSEAVDVRPPAN